MRHTYIGAILICSAFLSGCISPRLYPDSWPERAGSGSACLDISGRYKAVSRPIPTTEGPCEQSRMLQMVLGRQASCISLPMTVGTVYGPQAQHSWVEVKQTPDRLTFSYHVPKMEFEELLKKPFTGGKWPGRVTESGDGIIDRVLEQGRDYDCSGSGVDLILTSSWQNANIGAGRTSRYRKLLKAVDGSLVLDASELEYGFFWLPPFALVVYANRWVLWDPLDK